MKEALNRIYNMDCVEGMERLLSKYGEGCIDIIITSPPYNIGKMHSNQLQFGTYDGNDMKEPEYQAWQLRVLELCYKLLKPEGSMFYNHKVRIKNGQAIHPLEWLLKSDFILKQEITWDMGKSANCDKIRYFPFSERIYWLTKSPKTKIVNNLNLSDVWRVVPTHKRKETGHIAVMPEDIVSNILSSLDGDVVFDPFAGSGTTAKVTKDFGRSFIGFEISEDYHKLTNERLKELAKHAETEGD